MIHVVSCSKRDEPPYLVVDVRYLPTESLHLMLLISFTDERTLWCMRCGVLEPQMKMREWSKNQLMDRLHKHVEERHSEYIWRAP